MSSGAGFIIRAFDNKDAQACANLYREGLIGGHIAANDSGLDIDDIQMAYMKEPGNHFWVAEWEGQVVGMIGVMHSDGTAEIRRLRVADSHRFRGIGTALLETALKFCQDKNYLRVALDTFFEREAAIHLFGQYHFHLEKTRNYSGKESVYFYLDLYSGDQEDGNS